MTDTVKMYYSCLNKITAVCLNVAILQMRCSSFSPCVYMKAKSIVQNNIYTLFATSSLKFPESLNRLPYITRKPPICSGGITLKK